MLTTSKYAKKTQYVRDKPSTYFSIDNGNNAPKGVKGRGIVTVIEDSSRTISEGNKISMKYLGTLDHPIAKMVADGARKGDIVLIEINPIFFSTWDYGKVQIK